MRHWGLKLALVGAILLGPLAAQAQDKGIETIKRSSQWVVNFDANSCDVAAEFGTPEDPMFLQLTRYAPGDVTGITVLSNRLKTSQVWFEASFDFGLGEPATPGGVVGITQRKLPGILSYSTRFDNWHGKGDAPEITPAQEATITGVVVRAPGKKPFRLEFGPLDRPMKVMRQCLDDLIQSWGYDPAVIKGLSRRPSPAGMPQRWVTDDDFPSGALGHNGFLRFRLDVDAQGAVAGCHILDRTDPDDFSKATCALLTKRARFKPALDKDGKPIRAYYLGSFSWKS
ncbi:energy transducer TonB [Sphingomonas sp. HITSZ_GF]|uniref:energy transducer TonB n=1 Tax=Sphingomonas sp. HITSZ_GF TaxID=3037247 RepID=UPI00240D19EE|nr:energy transducer TonB [Sphingomonas sp. HITSZ_GF]MDG2533924.1 energy transducer TonB [Sphingomonas sp. HITSZ_GF]